jgi:hypothetical protein
MTISPRASGPVSSAEHLLSLYDEEFVRSVYQTLLGRSADESGLRNYLTQVRQGVAKSDVVVEVATSEEGRRANVQLPGLAELVRARRQARPTLIARLLRRVFGIASEPTQAGIRRLENQLFVLAEDNAQRIAHLEAALRGGAPQPFGLRPFGLAALGSHGESADAATAAAIGRLTPRARAMHARLRDALAAEAKVAA